jgi:hypothetical protein
MALICQKKIYGIGFINIEALAKALSRSSPYVSLTLVLYINNKEKIYNY